MTPKVSVLTTAYNHERYIAQAVTSALVQVTDFDYEVVVGEDCSTDRTRDILVDLQERYPRRIRLLLRPENWGGRRNFLDAFRACQGEYVALLEGDDFWISSDKLQRQADFLDRHPDCALCFCPAIKFFEDEKKAVLFGPSPVSQIYSLKDLLERNFIATCSVMFRNRSVETFPEWVHDVPALDWPLHVLNAQRGDVGYLDQVMAVHRIHSGGVWSPKGTLVRLQNKIAILTTLRRHLGPQYRDEIDEIVSRQHLTVMWVLVRSANVRALRAYVSNLSSNRHVRPGTLAKAMFRSLVLKLKRD